MQRTYQRYIETDLPHSFVQHIETVDGEERVLRESEDWIVYRKELKKAVRTVEDREDREDPPYVR